MPSESGLSIFQLARMARDWDEATLVKNHGPAFFLRELDAASVAGPMEQTLMGIAAKRANPAAGLDADYRVHALLKTTDKRFGGDYLAIGRGHANDVVIAHPSVSKRHAVLTEKAGRFFIADAGSRFGTLVNDQPVPGYRDGEAVALNDGDKVRLGDVRVTFALPARVLKLCKEA